MDIYSKQLALLLLLHFVFITEVTPQDNNIGLSSGTYSEIHGLKFSTETTTIRPIKDFLEVQVCLNNKEYVKANLLLDKIIAKKEADFSSPRRYYFIIGTAWFLKGELCLMHFDRVNAIRFFKKAYEYGNPYAPYYVATITRPALLQLEPNSHEFNVFYMACKELYEIGADLDDGHSAKELINFYQFENNIELQDYLFLTQIPNDSVSKAIQFYSFYKKDLTDTERLHYENIFSKYSIIGKSNVPESNELPGRSLLTSLYIEKKIHSDLSRNWGAFFDDSLKDSFGMKKSYEIFKNAVNSISPFLKAYVLINKNNYSSIEEHVTKSSKELLEVILPGDFIMINCGVLGHYATVWSIDRENDIITFLDPYEEFWETRNNGCVHSFEKIEYKYHRELCTIKLSELESMVVAVFTIRDNLKFMTEVEMLLKEKP